MWYDISTRPYWKDTKVWQVCEATKNNLFEKLHDEDPNILQINIFLVNEFTELLQEKPNPLNPSLKKVVVNTCKPYDDSINKLWNVLASYGVEMFVYDRKNYSSTMQKPSFFEFLGK
jgi:hypothetical protein